MSTGCSVPRDTWRYMTRISGKMSRRPSRLDRWRLSNQDFWDNRLSGQPAHLVDSAIGLKKQASTAENEDDSFYPADLFKLNESNVSAGSLEDVKMPAVT